MSKQKRGMFRLMLATMAGLMGVGAPRAKHYPDPMIRSPEQQRRKKRTGGSGSRRFAVERISRWRYPKCEPGTIAYHDMLVRKYGRKKADQIHRDWQHKDEFGNRDRLDRLPNASQLALRGDWDWRIA